MIASPSARVRRLGHQCIAALCARRGLPIPGEQDLADTGDSLDLRSFVDGWERTHRPAATSPDGQLEAAGPLAWWRQPKWERGALAMLSVVLVVMVLVRRPLLLGERVAAGDVVEWVAVDDSVLGELNEKLLAVSRSETQLVVPLTAAELAALAFGSSARRSWALGMHLTAHVDTALWLRGTAKSGRSFTMMATIRRIRAGRGELRVAAVRVDSVEVTASESSAFQIPGESSRGRLTFALPRFVNGLRMMPGGAVLDVGVRDGRRNYARAARKE